MTTQNELEQQQSAPVKKRIAFFCIPAHGHTNPMLPVAAELVRRGNTVRFYSFGGTGGLPDFSDKIRKTGAEFVACDAYMPEVSAEEIAGLKRVSITEMTVQVIRITLSMDAFLDAEFKSFLPDVVYTDSACFWGKLNAWKHHVPMVVSTSTFAFNQLSSMYMNHSAGEIADMIFGLARIGKALKSMEPYGYKVKNPLTLVQSDNMTDSVVYTSRRFQPFAESFSGHYAFVGPSVFSDAVPDKKKARPLVYISLGTVINDRPDFYGKCIEALKDMDVDVLISCGMALDREKLGHIATSKLVFDAAFTATLPNWPSKTRKAAKLVPIYYMDTLAGVNFLPEEFVDITDEIDLKIQMLECHHSQLDWMREHDGIDFADMVRTCSRYRGYQCGAAYAEGFRSCKAYLRGTTARMLP